jgi:thioredoxin 1
MKLRLIIFAISLMFATTACAAELPSATDAEINRAFLSGKPSVIDLGARSCIPCKKMAPILESLAKEYRGQANVLFIDVWENKSAGGRFRVQMIPTQIFFDSRGKEVKRHIGFMDKEALVKELSALGAKLK